MANLDISVYSHVYTDISSNRFTGYAHGYLILIYIDFRNQQLGTSGILISGSDSPSKCVARCGC